MGSNTSSAPFNKYPEPQTRVPERMSNVANPLAVSEVRKAFALLLSGTNYAHFFHNRIVASRAWPLIELDGSDNVTTIVARDVHMEGELGWRHLMELPQLRVLDLQCHKLSGVINTTEKLRSLPLVTLNLLRSDRSGSPLTGEFDLSHLPVSIVCVALRNNNFTIKNWSSVANLPVLTRLSLAANDLSTAGDNIDFFSVLPGRLKRLSLEQCTFAAGATADVAGLPIGIRDVILNDTVNLTLRSSDIIKFAQLGLSDESKTSFCTVPVVLGRVGGDGAGSSDHAASRLPVVSGKQLLEMAAPVFAVFAAFSLRAAAAAAAAQSPPNAPFSGFAAAAAAVAPGAPLPPPQQQQLPVRREREENEI